MRGLVLPQQYDVGSMVPYMVRYVSMRDERVNEFDLKNILRTFLFSLQNEMGNRLLALIIFIFHE